MDEGKTKIKMDDGVARFFTRFRGNLFVDLWEAQQNKENRFEWKRKRAELLHVSYV